MLGIAHGILSKVHLPKNFNMWRQVNVKKLIRLVFVFLNKLAVTYSLNTLLLIIITM